MKYLWLIDAGHGSDTAGKRSPEWDDGTQLFEWKFNRLVAQELIELLCMANYQFEIIVPESTDISLSRRVKRANINAEKHSDKQCIYISIHGNAGGESAHGIEVFTSKGQTRSDKFATILLNELKGLGWRMRYDTFRDGDEDKEANFYVLKHTSMPAVLSENGFYSNYDECQKMLDPEWQGKIAYAHFEAIKKVEQGKLI